MNAPGAGTRARSRQLGYAEAMRDISHLIGDQARKWKGTGEQQLDPAAHALTLALAEQLRQLADYASAVHDVYLNGDATFARDAQWRDMAEREGYCPRGPAELPQREHPESN